MSGHSKWATIHRAKEAKDAKKGAIFTKVAMAISVAVKQGGGIGDPDKNFRLRLAMDKARTVNMPKENISRAIEKGMGGGGGAAFEELSYEGFLPGGAAVIVEVVTDNRARTSQQVRNLLEKGGGTMGNSGSVSYMFSPVGVIVADLSGKSIDEAEMISIDAGATDFEADEAKLIVYCNKDDTFTVKEKLEQAGLRVESAEMVMKPSTEVEIADAAVRQKADEIVDALDELDDVSKVWTNLI